MNDHAPLLERAFCLDPEEGSYRIDRIDGSVPDYLRGTYYLNGPARFRRGDVRYGHWLDGDGMVCSLRFTGDGVRFANRYVRGTKLREEEKAGKALYRTFGTRFEGDLLLHGVGLESPVNVSVYRFGDALLACGEQGLPWELDPMTLETRGRFTFGRKLNPISPFSAHAHFDPESGEMFNFGVSFSARRPCINLYRFAADGGMVYRQRLPIDHPASMHDFAISPSFAIFYLAPHILDMGALMRGDRTLMEALTWEPERGSRLILGRRENGEMAASIPIGSKYCLHLIGGFEKDGHLLVDVVELDEPVYDQYAVPDLFTEVRTAQPRRYVVDVEAAAVVETVDVDYRLMCDFPATDPRRWSQEYRDFWVLGISATHEEGRKFFDQVVHVDWRGAPEIWQAAPRHYLGGEPLFLPDPSEERRGTVVCQQFDADTVASSFLLFDAFDVAGGPVATLHLESPVHLGFHTSWAPEDA